jgi:hypothetical protein
MLQHPPSRHTCIFLSKLYAHPLLQRTHAYLRERLVQHKILMLCFFCYFKLQNQGANQGMHAALCRSPSATDTAPFAVLGSTPPQHTLLSSVRVFCMVLHPVSRLLRMIMQMRTHLLQCRCSILASFLHAIICIICTEAPAQVPQKCI